MVCRISMTIAEKNQSNKIKQRRSSSMNVKVYRVTNDVKRCNEAINFSRRGLLTNSRKIETKAERKVERGILLVRVRKQKPIVNVIVRPGGRDPSAEAGQTLSDLWCQVINRMSPTDGNPIQTSPTFLSLSPFVLRHRASFSHTPRRESPSFHFELLHPPNRAIEFTIPRGRPAEYPQLPFCAFTFFKILDLSLFK